MLTLIGKIIPRNSGSIMKRRFFALLACQCFALAVCAQVTFVVQSLPASTPPTDSLYIAGDFCGWQPGLPDYMLHKNPEQKWSITLPAQAAGTVIEFKFTRGSWSTVEKGPSGQEIPNRTYTFGTTAGVVDVVIANWADGSGAVSTAAPNVKIISTAFYMPQLDRTRRIWVYFPPDYETSGKTYPVLYMHDGQNLFDAATSFAGEWEVDETLNSLAEQGKNVPLVVGVDNGGSYRLDEYTPWRNPQYGGGDGEKYGQFITETLKPYIDQHYRTRPGREYTGVMGSSLGGLISHFAAVNDQEVFSKAGLFSPSYWFSDTLWAFTHDAGRKQDVRFYQLCGSNEGGNVVTDMQRMNDSLVGAGFPQDQVANKVVAGGQHNEKLWRENFGEAYLWLFSTYADPNATEEHPLAERVRCFPNPARDHIVAVAPSDLPVRAVSVFNPVGTCVKRVSWPAENRVSVGDLPPGTYILECEYDGGRLTGKFTKE